MSGFSQITRLCNTRGRWDPVDTSGCTVNSEADYFAIVVLEVITHASVTDVKSNEKQFLKEVCICMLSKVHTRYSCNKLVLDNVVLF